jgi:hypothetical protein
MTTQVLIGPKTFEVLFYSLIFFYGLDLTWSGYRVIKDKTHKYIRPKLLAYWIINIFQTPKKNKNINYRFYDLFYSIRNIGWYALIGGILSLLASGIMLCSFIFS